jgi:hypothetical protein
MARVLGAAVHQGGQGVGAGAKGQLVLGRPELGMQRFKNIHQVGQPLHRAPLHHIAGDLAAPGGIGLHGIAGRAAALPCRGEQRARRFRLQWQQGLRLPQRVRGAPVDVPRLRQCAHPAIHQAV